MLFVGHPETASCTRRAVGVVWRGWEGARFMHLNEHARARARLGARVSLRRGGVGSVRGPAGGDPSGTPVAGAALVRLEVLVVTHNYAASAARVGAHFLLPPAS